MLSCERKFDVTLQYLTIYAATLLILVAVLNLGATIKVREVLWSGSIVEAAIFLAGLFRMGGRPPFIGFFAKIAVIQVLLAKGGLLVGFTLVARSVFLLYMYMRIFYYLLGGLSPRPLTNVSKAFYGAPIVLVLSLTVCP